MYNHVQNGITTIHLPGPYYFLPPRPTRVYPEVEPRIPTEEQQEIRSQRNLIRRTAKFKRVLSFINVVNFIINIMIGSGIFTSPGTILRESGSVGMSLIMWFLSAAIAFMTMIPFAELCAVVPQAGSQYIYIQEAFADLHPFWGQLPGFVFIWMNVLIQQPLIITSRTMLSADYIYGVVAQAISEEVDSRYGVTIQNLIGSILLLIVGFILCQSMTVYAISQDFLVYFKITLCGSIILSGAYMVITEQAIDVDMSLADKTLPIDRLPLILYFGLFAFEGPVMITAMTEEIKDPEINFQKGLIIAMVLVTTTYILLILSFLSAVSFDEITTKPAIAKLFGEKVFGVQGGIIINIGVAIGAVSTNMSCMLYSSRLGFAAAREGHLMELLSYIHCKKLTPLPSVITQVLLCLFFINVSEDIDNLISGYSFVTWFYYGVCMVALIVLRVKKPFAYRPIRIPIVVPALVLVISWLLVLASMAAQPVFAYGPGVSLVFIGIPINYLFVYKKKRFPGINKITQVLQKWLNIIPAS